MNALDLLLACKGYDDVDAWFEANTVDEVLTDEAVAALNHASELGTELSIMINSSYAWQLIVPATRRWPTYYMLSPGSDFA